MSRVASLVGPISAVFGLLAIVLAVGPGWQPSLAAGPLAGFGLAMGIMGLCRAIPSRRGSALAGLGTLLCSVALGLTIHAVTADRFLYRQFPRAMRKQATCAYNLKHLGEAIAAYAERNGGRLPLASSWQDAIRPYVSLDDAFRCPGQPFWERAGGYALNAQLSGKARDSIASPNCTVLVFEADAAQGRSPAPDSVVCRHSGGLNVLYADGHAKWQKLDYFARDHESVVTGRARRQE